jgi:hypothetical protein
MMWTNRLGKWLLVGSAWSAAALALGAAGAGCLSRPVGKQPPTTKVNFTSALQQQSVTKVDLLFAIDNSQSMGDKQAILAKAVPDLIRGLVRPACIDSEGKPLASGQLADPSGSGNDRYGCPEGSEPEFKPVTDMHIGVVSSSLGSLGGDVCDSKKFPRKNDRARLLNLNPGGGQVEAAGSKNFLAWFPQNDENENEKLHPTPENPIRTIDGKSGLEESFKNLVVGVAQDGCGLEAQLESVYRFLIQPDPWEEVVVNDKAKAEFKGIDTELLRQRADFLRPDSLVAVIMLTDEDDSSADPMSVGGQGWAFMANNFPSSSVSRPASGGGTTAPRGTSACDTDPGAKDETGEDLCNSCGISCDPSKPSCQRIKQDRNCKESRVENKSGAGFDGYYGPKEDSLNVRFHRMKQRFGVDPQYPLQRYIDGFRNTKIPDSKAEHVVSANGNVAAYTSTPKCTNPLFAESLPRGEPNDELCNRPVGRSRTPDRVFFALVGGVPHQLLHFDPEDAEKSKITDSDWVKIIGKAPEKYDYSGIDPHMIQSPTPRDGLGSGASADVPRGDNGSDPIHGREWKTDGEDLQYACTFDLPESDQRTCAQGDSSCDCSPGETVTNPPLCDGNKQIKAKSYPTIRQLRLVRALGDQGIVSSLCPIQLTDENAKTYGYRPAVSAIVNRLKKALTSTCLPQRLRDPNEEAKEVPCLVLAQLPEQTDQCSNYGLSAPDAKILELFREQERVRSGNVVDGGVDLSKLPVCEIPQETVARGASCKDVSAPRWCYVENDPANKLSPAGECGQAVLFSRNTDRLANARYSLVCIRQFSGGEAAGVSSAK